MARLDAVPPEKAQAAASGARPPRFTKRAARGEAAPEATLDLHGLDRETASSRLRSFLSGLSREVEVVLIVHGRGQGILAAAATAELDQHARVAEHLPAPQRLGGLGARLVRLRR